MLKRLPLLALFALAACRPEARGRCATASDCRAGASCAVGGICVASSGHCAPSCGAGELCNNDVCVALKPVVRVLLDSQLPIAPASPRVHVRIDAAAGIALGALTVSVDSDRVLAAGSIAAAVPGDNYVTLSHFDPEAVGPVSVSATVAYTPGGGAADNARSVAVPATIDAQAPLVSAFVATGSGAVGEWVARTTTGTQAETTLEVTAQVDDQTGSGAASATLDLDDCPPSSPCSYAGTLVPPRTNGAAKFSFLVPRAVQAPGSEALIAATVSARDKAGNVGRASIPLHIDDAAPAIGAVKIVSQNGVTGEDGKTWFAGGPSAGTVEISIAVADNGVGLSLPDVALSLSQDDTDGNPGPIQPLLPPPGDGTLHFRLPASEVVGREGHLRFSLSAADKLAHANTLPASDATALWIDDVPPHVEIAVVDYAGASPPLAQVCAANSSTFTCGRDSTHLLRDDAATVTFQAWDCGAGLGSSATATIGRGGAVNATQTGASGTPCAGRPNQIHTYSLPLDVATHLPQGNDPATGQSAISLVSHATDRTGHAEGNTAQGSALLSLWRWKTLLNAGARVSGAPALLPGAAPRRILAGTEGATGNLQLLNPNGSLAWRASLSPSVENDVAVDANGTSYAVSGDHPCSGSASCGTLNIVDSAGKPATSACSLTSEGFGAPPAITVVNNAPAVVVAATSTTTLADNALLLQLSSGKCSEVGKGLLFFGAGAGNLTGVTLSGATVFFSHAAGFSSIAQKQGGFDSQTVVSFSSGSGTTVAAKAPPSILSAAALNALFSGSDQLVRRTVQGCGASPCWTTDPGPPMRFTPADLAGNPVGTPVFDAAAIYAMNDAGVLSAWSRDTGGLLGRVAPTVANKPVSAPVLLQQSSALLVQQDGEVRLATPSSSSAAPLMKVGAFASGTPPAPVIDVRGAGGVAYVPDGAGWLWAIQLDRAPLDASANAWPRPGRDTCNSRNAGASYCP